MTSIISRPYQSLPATPMPTPTPNPFDHNDDDTTTSNNTTTDPTTTRPPPPTRTRSSSLLHRTLLTRLRPLPFQYVFTLHHTKSTSSTAPTLLAPSIPDIATFYKIYNNFPWDSLPLRDGVHFFRSGVQPLWEDPENVRGGCWVVKVRRDAGRALRCWEELCLMVCGGELQEVVSRERDHILGISYSSRLYVSHISIWTKQGDNKRSIEALQRTILSRLSEDLKPASEGEYYYKKHRDHEGFVDALKEVR